MTHAEATVQARIIKALANPIRLMIVDELSRGERCVCQLQPLFTIDQSTLSRHLAVLKNVGVVTERREGTRVIHRLAKRCVLRVIEGVGAALPTAAPGRTGEQPA